MERLFGYGPGELIGASLIDLIAPAHRNEVFRRALSKDERNYESLGLRKDGTEFPVEFAGKPIEYNGRNLRVKIARDLTERKRIEESMRIRENDLARAQTAVHLGSWRWDLAKDVVTWSDELYRVFGVDPKTFVPSNAAANQMIHPEDRGLHSELAAVALTGQTVAPFECRIIRPNGEERIVLASGFEAEFDSSGKPTVLFGTVLDITERKQAERRIVELNRDLDRHVKELKQLLQEKSVLLREVQHRVKNNLQLISSLAYMQARQAGDNGTREALLAMQGRVRSMSLVHESLCFSGVLAEIDFSKYVQGLAQRLVQSYAAHPAAIRLHVDVDVTLRLDEATPCGLIVNELLSNALKHAFPHSANGDIWITFHQDKSEFVLEVRDNGVGMPPGYSPEASNSLGLQVVADLAEQVNGTFSWANGGGSAFQVKFRRRSAEPLGDGSKLNQTPELGGVV
jgi:PAS domain S-box-containing protein